MSRNIHERKTVLVVDDSAFMREMVAKLVERMGHHCLKAEDGSIALELVQEQVPHLIILDVKMPRIDGLTLLRTLRADPRFKETPIIMLTSAGDMEIVSQAAAKQISAYLLKDDPKEVIRRLREFL